MVYFKSTSRNTNTHHVLLSHCIVRVFCCLFNAEKKVGYSPDDMSFFFSPFFFSYCIICTTVMSRPNGKAPYCASGHLDSSLGSATGWHWPWASFNLNFLHFVHSGPGWSLPLLMLQSALCNPAFMQHIKASCKYAGGIIHTLQGGMLLRAQGEEFVPPS